MTRGRVARILASFAGLEGSLPILDSLLRLVLEGTFALVAPGAGPLLLAAFVGAIREAWHYRPTRPQALMQPTE